MFYGLKGLHSQMFIDDDSFSAEKALAWAKTADVSRISVISRAYYSTPTEKYLI